MIFALLLIAQARGKALRIKEYAILMLRNVAGLLLRSRHNGLPLQQASFATVYRVLQAREHTHEPTLLVQTLLV